MRAIAEISRFISGAAGFVGLLFADRPLALSFLKWMVYGECPALEGLGAPRSRVCRVVCGDASNMAIDEGLAGCQALGLEVPPGMYAIPKDHLSAVWNGMGPDSWNRGVRALIDRLGAVVVLCSLPHDVWYEVFCDGTYATWRITMDQWRRNSDKCVAAANRAPGAGWWRRRYNEFSADTVLTALEAGAYQAWLLCYSRKHQERHARRIREYLDMQEPSDENKGATKCR